MLTPIWAQHSVLRVLCSTDAPHPTWGGGHPAKFIIPISPCDCICLRRVPGLNWMWAYPTCSVFLQGCLLDFFFLNSSLGNYLIIYISKPLSIIPNHQLMSSIGRKSPTPNYNIIIHNISVIHSQRKRRATIRRNTPSISPRYLLTKPHNPRRVEPITTNIILHFKLYNSNLTPHHYIKRGSSIRILICRTQCRCKTPNDQKQP